MNSYFSYLESELAYDSFWTYDSLTDLRQISPVIQSHLKKVYLTLCYVVLSLLRLLELIFISSGTLEASSRPLVAGGSLVWMTSILKKPHEEQKGVAVLTTAGFCYGATFGLAIDFAIPIHPSILVSASVGCAVAFGCFSVAAMLVRRRDYLYLGGLLSSSLSLLFWLHFAYSVVGGSDALFRFDLYFVLLVFVVYIVVHTQGILKRAHSGDLNYVNHAFGLFNGILMISFGLFVIMLQNFQNGKENKKEKEYILNLAEELRNGRRLSKHG